MKTIKMRIVPSGYTRRLMHFFKICILPRQAYRDAYPLFDDQYYLYQYGRAKIQCSSTMNIKKNLTLELD